MRHFAKRLRALRVAAPSLALELAGYAGCGLVSFGVGMIYRPAGVIAAGIFLLTVALIAPRRR